MFEQEHLRFINMLAAAGVNGSGGGATKHTRGIMEHTVITNLKCEVVVSTVAPAAHYSLGPT